MAITSSAEANAVKAQRVKTQRLSNRILLALLSLSVLLNVVLARNIALLKDSIEYIKAEMRASRELKPGESVPPLKGKDLYGNPAEITYPGNGPATILYVFSPDCEWCTRNMENIKTLTSHIKSDFRFIGVSLSKNNLRDYLAKYALEFPVYCDLTFEVLSAYKLGGTPRTMVVSNEGKVVKTWFGAYVGNLKGEVEEYFHVSLPGVVETQTHKENSNTGCESCGETKTPEQEKGGGQ
jgi:peroxiredoxin